MAKRRNDRSYRRRAWRACALLCAYTGGFREKTVSESCSWIGIETKNELS
jgi:hypothetical protein